MSRTIFLSRATVCLAVALLLVADACSKSPTTPTPPTPPDPLALSCPAPIAQTSSSGLPMSIRYGATTATGGTPPVQITCTPASDSMFPVGSTMVTCRGVDSKGVTGTCSFAVAVSAPPRLVSGATSFVAFGDSITAGEITVQGEGGIRTLTVRDDLSYPTDLRQSLAARYTAQSILVVNSGVTLESTSGGLARLPGVLAAQYQVLLLMEGANDISDGSSQRVDTALSNMRSMVRLAKARGIRVFLGTLPPQNPIACCPRRGTGEPVLGTYNNGVKGIASSEGVPVVDVFTAFNGDVTTLIGPDGLHPTAAGYLAIAGAFFSSIKTTLEAPPTSSVPSMRAPLFAAPWRR